MKIFGWIILCCFLLGEEYQRAEKLIINQNDLLSERNIGVQNLERAIQLADNTFMAYFDMPNMKMARYFNPYYKQKSDETGSIWMYTSAIEAVNSILRSLKIEKEYGDGLLYEKHYYRYEERLLSLYENIDYYMGMFCLTSYTQTRDWSVFGVHRSEFKKKAKVEGIENVYDDQMWLIREYLESYKITGQTQFLEAAEYLTSYVLDGWDCNIDTNGNEIGGITWGPGYVTKHACSNGPMVSPLVWLAEIYKNKEDKIIHKYIDPEDRRTRKTEEMKKSSYYLMFAVKLYEWQKENLLRNDGVYADMMGGCTPGEPGVDTIGSSIYRKGIICDRMVGPAYSYNTGTMLSGAADLYHATNKKEFLEDGSVLSDLSFKYFAKIDSDNQGHYTYEIDGFKTWFNGVLMRGYVDFYPFYNRTEDYIESFQKNLDNGYDQFLYEGFLPVDLLNGWDLNKKKNEIEGMFSFTFVSEYAVLSEYRMKRK